MCELCHKYPHDNRCPYAPEPKVFGYCEECGRELREDYEYYTDNEENQFCSSECAEKHHGIKSKFYERFNI